jgi:hypothetical protein
MIDFDETFTMNPSLIISIKRIEVSETIFKSYKLIPIKNSAYFFVSGFLKTDSCMLPKLYAALVYLTGLSDSWYDDYKGSYSFTFELAVQKNHIISKYLYHMYHYRSYIEFSIYHIVPETDPRDIQIMHQPNEMLFSDKDICNFSGFFCSYSLKCMNGAEYIPKPFVKYSDSNFLLFGYSQNEYFIKEYDDQDKYTREKLQLQNEMSNCL